MTDTTGMVRHDAADLAESLLTHDNADLERPFTILTHRRTNSLIERREALRPLYEAIVARIGQPTLLGGTAHGPSVRWNGSERILLLSGDHSKAVLCVHEAQAFVQEEYSRFDSGGLPYTWQLDRHGPGHDHGWTFNGHAAANGWTQTEERLAGMLASWAEHMPLQAPGDWVSFKLWASRDWGRTMIVSFEPAQTNSESYACIDDRDHEQTPERAAQMRARGWQDVDDTGRWYTRLPETDPAAPATLARLIVTDLRARGTVSSHEVSAWDISAGDRGELWVPGIGVDVHPRRGEHF
ncbi:hypothetical protein GCM10022285_66880 [Streptomyces tunisiensis]|uniref:DUF317 domain-containing protein n=1 Tax=Streptomyces tunisiensis TaxID=948699 RepID=A0ABP7ZCG9_9ACTN